MSGRVIFGLADGCRRRNQQNGPSVLQTPDLLGSRPSVPPKKMLGSPEQIEAISVADPCQDQVLLSHVLSLLTLLIPVLTIGRGP